GLPFEKGTGIRNINFSIAFALKGRNGHKYGVLNDFKFAKKKILMRNPSEKPITPKNAVIRTKKKFINLFATLNSYLGVTYAPIVLIAAYKTTSGLNKPTLIAMSPMTIAAINPSAVASGVGV